MKRKILAALGGILLAVGLTLPAAATDQPEVEVCTEVVLVPEYLYERYVPQSHEEPVYKTQYEVDKFTRTREFKLHPYGWGPWSTPTSWQPTGSHLAWVDVVAAPVWKDHADGFGWEREWAVLATGQTRQVQTGTVTVEDEPLREEYGWTEEGPELEGWTLIDQRDREDVVEVECPVPPTTVPPVTEPPVTDPPVTTPPVTEPPVVTPPPAPPVVEVPVVVEQPVVEETTELAFTGSDAPRNVGIGVAFLVTGLGLVLGARRRRAA